MHLFAYLDPGTGSLIIQAAIAGMLGAGFYFRRFVIGPVQSLVRLVTRARPEAGQQPAAPPVES